MFKEDNVHTLEITFNNKEYATIQIDECIPIKLIAPRQDLLEAWAFVVCFFRILFFFF